MDFSRPLNPLVVINYWRKDEQSIGELHRLIRSMRSHDAGAHYDTAIVCNCDSPPDPELDDAASVHGVDKVLYRENTGRNVAAWNHAYLNFPDYNAYLFLQSECEVIASRWLRSFVKAGLQPGVGLVGELLNMRWAGKWSDLDPALWTKIEADHAVGGIPSARVPAYLDYFRREKIDPGPSATHLQSIILFTSRHVLDEIAGFPLGTTHCDEIAAEIAISKKIENLGYSIVQVANRPLTYIQHRQWLNRRRAYDRILRDVMATAAG